MKTLSLALLALCIASGGALADLVIAVQHTEMDVAPPAVTRWHLYMANDRLAVRMESPDAAAGEDNTAMIYRGDREQLIMVDHDQRMYMVLDKEAVSQMSKQMADASGQMAEAMKQMQEQLAQLPEEQRQMIEKYAKGQVPVAQPTPKKRVHETRKTGRKEKINGHGCTSWENYVDGVKKSEVWVTDWRHVDVAAEDFQIFKDMARFQQELFASDPTFSQLPTGEDMFQGFDEIDGFPILIREFEGSEVSGETLFESVEKTKVDPANYEPPADYRQRQIGMSRE